VVDPIRPGERIHVIGIAGSGAAGTALLLQRAGAIVDGCDADDPSPYTPPLDAVGIPHLAGHDPAHLDGVDRVAITPAIRAVPDHREHRAAIERGVPVATWQELLGELMDAPGRVGIGVTGTHGKSTTTALLGHLLATAGLDPTVEVGAMIPAWGASVRAGNGVPFVVEADEFGDNFLAYHPAGSIVTNVEMDHPDYFADANAVIDSFERFVRGMRGDPALGGRLLFIGAADPGARTLAARLGDWEGRIVTFGPGGNVEATEVERSSAATAFTLFDRRWEMSLAGAHNVLNAAAALAMARELGAADVVVFTGQQPAREIPSFVQACDVLVSPRIRGTNTPLKIYSYLRSGKPIVATDLLTHTQVLTPDIAALVAPEPEAFAEALAHLLDNPRERAALAARARAVADAKYSRESYVRRTAQAYARLSNGAPGQASSSIPVAER